MSFASTAVDRTEPATSASVLVVDDDPTMLLVLSGVLRSAGYDVTVAHDAEDALAKIAETIPDIIVSDVDMPGKNGFAFVTELRATTRGRTVPLIFLTALDSSESLVQGLALGADDYLCKPVVMSELLARVRAKLERRPLPVALLSTDPRTGVESRAAFDEELTREALRCRRSGRDGRVAVLACAELPRLRAKHGGRIVAAVEQQVVGLIQAGADGLDIVGRGERDQFLVLLPERSEGEAQARLEQIAAAIAGAKFTAARESIRLTPAIGHAAIGEVSAAEAVERAAVAASHSGSHLDTRPRAWEPAMEPIATRSSGRVRTLAEHLRLPFQIGLTFLPLILPYFAYIGLERLGISVAPIAYLVVVISLIVTATMIWVEGIAALRAPEPPLRPGAPEPPATAIIAAYLPNEAATIVETVEAFLEVDYPAGLEVILAYNTPSPLPVEDVLREIAGRDARLVLHRVEGSTSKAQNVNAALAVATGEFVGVFDADHHPQADSFRRAWRWLSNGYDVVQGHCQVRNGDNSWVARTVAVEFEHIYAVSHPGRARVHGFGIFGGSNGYWRTQLLAETRMRGWMLTEDIDASMRVIAEGSRIASDPGLISRELAPATLRALWNQRMRWAQGWFQVALRHGWRSLRAEGLTPRNRVGLAYLLLWREIYPWTSLQMFPILAFYVHRAGGTDRLDWTIPLFVLTTVFTMSTGPLQTFFAYHLAAPEIRERGRWFLLYLLVNAVFYTEFKNVIARVAQVKELMRERTWKVTPRSVQTNPVPAT